MTFTPRHAPAELLALAPNDEAREAAMELYEAQWNFERAQCADSFGSVQADLLRYNAALDRANAAKERFSQAWR